MLYRLAAMIAALSFAGSKVFNSFANAIELNSPVSNLELGNSSLIAIASMVSIFFNFNRPSALALVDGEVFKIFLCSCFPIILGE